jgi:hypothetical protein
MPLARCRSSTLPKARDVALTFDRPQPTQVFFALSCQALLISSTHPSVTRLQCLLLRGIVQGSEVERNFIPHHHTL